MRRSGAFLIATRPDKIGKAASNAILVRSPIPPHAEQGANDFPLMTNAIGPLTFAILTYSVAHGVGSFRFGFFTAQLPSRMRRLNFGAWHRPLAL